MSEQQPRYIGTEVEYGVPVSPYDEGIYRALSDRTVREALGNQAWGRSLTGRNEIGALIYEDHTHPEYSTPECYQAVDAKNHELLGEQYIMAAFSRAIAGFSSTFTILGFKAELTKKNTMQRRDEHSELPSWGVHDNYQIARESCTRLDEDADFTKSIAAHNITRQIFTGAGGYVDDTYYVAPRSLTFYRLAADETRHNRPIVNTRDEPLATERLYRRIHNISGEGNISPWQIHMKLGTTALEHKALERGEYFADLFPIDPVGAMRTVGSDTNLEAVIVTEKGETDALAIQREILRRCKAYAETDDELLIVDEWEQVLDNLERYRHDKEVTKFLISLDWLAKLKIIDRRAGYKGNSPQRLDMQYAVLLDSRGRHGLGYIMRQNGAFRLTPEEDITIDKAAALPSSARARMRGRLASSPLQNSRSHTILANWSSYKMERTYSSISREPRIFPDHPTPEEEQAFYARLEAEEAYARQYHYID